MGYLRRVLLPLVVVVLLPACSYAEREPEEAWKLQGTVKSYLKRVYGHTRYTNLVASQIWQESRFKPDATSPVGAHGCGQFMPATKGDAKYWGRDLGAIDWSNCKHSVKASMRYMRAIYRRIRGNPDYAYAEAIKDYNRGMGWGDRERRTGTCLRNARACRETTLYSELIYNKHQLWFHSMGYGKHYTQRRTIP